MQQNANQNVFPEMSISPNVRDQMKNLKSVPALADARLETLEKLVEASEEVTLSQGQTLLRIKVIETHAFLLLEGSLRLLAEEPQRRELFTVGRLEPGELIGVVDLLRQGPCEAAIARQPCRLLSFPQALLLDLYLEDPGLKKGLDQLSSPCEGAVVLGKQLGLLNPPPPDGKEWIIEQLQYSNSTNVGNPIQLLSSLIRGEEELVGLELSEEEKEQLQTKCRLTLRFWRWNANKSGMQKVSSLNEQSSTRRIEKNIPHRENTWYPNEQLDLPAIGLREASSEGDLQGFKPIRGKGPVGQTWPL